VGLILLWFWLWVGIHLEIEGRPCAIVCGTLKLPVAWGTSWIPVIIFKPAGIVSYVVNYRPLNNRIGERISWMSFFSDKISRCPGKGVQNQQENPNSTLVLCSLSPPRDLKAWWQEADKEPSQTEWIDWPPIFSVHLWARVWEVQTSSYMRESDSFWKPEWSFKVLSSFGGKASLRGAALSEMNSVYSCEAIQARRAAANWETASPISATQASFSASGIRGLQ